MFSGIRLISDLLSEVSRVASDLVVILTSQFACWTDGPPDDYDDSKDLTAKSS